MKCWLARGNMSMLSAIRDKEKEMDDILGDLVGKLFRRKKTSSMWPKVIGGAAAVAAAYAAIKLYPDIKRYIKISSM
jgi:hypothetical protein